MKNLSVIYATKMPPNYTFRKIARAYKIKNEWDPGKLIWHAKLDFINVGIYWKIPHIFKFGIVLTKTF